MVQGERLRKRAALQRRSRRLANAHSHTYSHRPYSGVTDPTSSGRVGLITETLGAFLRSMPYQDERLRL